MARIPHEITRVEHCTCGGTIWHRDSPPRCALLDLGDPTEVDRVIGEAEDRIKAYTAGLNARLANLDGHAVVRALAEDPDWTP
jgi:hypothetical protein